MNALAAVMTGIGLGLAFHGGLWLTLGLLRRGSAMALLAASRVVRIALAGVVFYALLQQGTAALLEGVGGFWLARLLCVRWALRTLGPRGARPQACPAAGANELRFHRTRFDG